MELFEIDVNNSLKLILYAETDGTACLPCRSACKS